MRTPDLVLVPALVGLDAAQAHEVAMEARVVAVDPEPDTPPTLSGTVVAQRPEPGERIPAGDAVTVWIEDQGGGGGGGGGLQLPDSPPPKDPAGVK
jgi:beta-lactam-binding protein with PASTA domain